MAADTDTVCVIRHQERAIRDAVGGIAGSFEPANYHQQVHESSWRSMILMEDVAATRGAEFIQATTPLTRGQVEDVLVNMASYHGAWWEAPELKILKTPTDHFNNVSLFIDFESRCAVGMERAKSVVPKRLYGQADRLWEGTQKSLEIATKVLSPTLLHGDSHVGQTYITGDGRMGLADWQATMQGGWAYDYAYFVGSACEPEDRRLGEGATRTLPRASRQVGRKAAQLRRGMASVPAEPLLPLLGMGVHHRARVLPAKNAARRRVPCHYQEACDRNR